MGFDEESARTKICEEESSLLHTESALELSDDDNQPKQSKRFKGLWIGGILACVLLVAAQSGWSSTGAPAQIDTRYVIGKSDLPEMSAVRRGTKGAERIFCFAFAMHTSGEPLLMAKQYKEHLTGDPEQGVGIFDCDNYLVFTDTDPEKLWDASLFPDSEVPRELVDRTVQIHGNTRFKKGGQFNVILCAPLFKKLWRYVFEHIILDRFDWFVKVDPDTVFLPGRLRAYLTSYCERDKDREESHEGERRKDRLLGSDKGEKHKAHEESHETHEESHSEKHKADEESRKAHEKNHKKEDKCATLDWLNWGIDMHGPLEVLSTGAVRKYRDADQCEKDIDCSDDGEDWCLVKCLKSVGVPSASTKEFLWDGTYQNSKLCGSNKVAFHPYKTWEKHAECLHLAQEKKGTVKDEDLPRKGDSHILDAVGLETLLGEKLGGLSFSYIVNVGNAGDALIQYGTMLLFRKLGFKFNIADGSKEFSNSLLVFAGAGNLVGLYPGCKDFLELNAPLEKNNTIVLLPATIKDSQDVLETLDYNVYVITRERRSYEYVKHILEWDHVFLAQDMAFFLEDLDPALKKARNSMPSKPNVGMLFRTDSEKTFDKLPPGNHDFSAELPMILFPWKDHPDGISEDVDGFIDTCANIAHRVYDHLKVYTSIYTSRLHMCITSTLMGRDTHCYPNSYWKNEEIYKFSIMDRYPNSHFDLTRDPDLSKLPLASPEKQDEEKQDENKEDEKKADEDEQLE